MGDVDYDSALKTASFITPVPGGVGPMTVASLMENTFVAAHRDLEKSQQRIVKGLKLHLLKDVPRSVLLQLSLLVTSVMLIRYCACRSDIAIAKAQTPKPIADLAVEIGISPAYLELYGRYKAKVKLEILESLKHRQYVVRHLLAGQSLTLLGPSSQKW